MRKITVNVTQDCIDSGLPQEPDFCPITLAMKGMEEIYSDLDIETLDETVSFVFNGERFAVVPLPPEAICFIAAFDDEQDVSPFSFELEVP